MTDAQFERHCDLVHELRSLEAEYDVFLHTPGYQLDAARWIHLEWTILKMTVELEELSGIARSFDDYTV